jgi:hypothetical protein
VNSPIRDKKINKKIKNYSAKKKKRKKKKEGFQTVAEAEFGDTLVKTPFFLAFVFLSGC